MSVALSALLSIVAATSPERATTSSGGAGTAAPVLVGLDAEFGYAHSTSAEAIRQGITIALEEINRAGGVRGGRPLALEERANHSVPARSITNVAQAYDLTHLLARAIDEAGSTDRRAIRDALEQLGPYHGLVKTLPQPFTSRRHEALAPADAFIARYANDGAIVRSPAVGLAAHGP
jgi:ABC-type branched-subunit amino acid transport system substrate-binding protein